VNYPTQYAMSVTYGGISWPVLPSVSLQSEADLTALDWLVAVANTALGSFGYSFTAQGVVYSFGGGPIGGSVGYAMLNGITITQSGGAKSSLLCQQWAAADYPILTWITEVINWLYSDGSVSAAIQGC